MTGKISDSPPLPPFGRVFAYGLYRQASVPRFREMLLSYNFLCCNSKTARLTQQQPSAVLRALDSGREGGGGAYGRLLSH